MLQLIECILQVMLFVNLIDVNDVSPRFSSPFGYIVLVDEDLEVNSIITSTVRKVTRISFVL